MCFLLTPHFHTADGTRDERWVGPPRPDTAWHCIDRSVGRPSTLTSTFAWHGLGWAAWPRGKAPAQLDPPGPITVKNSHIWHFLLLWTVLPPPTATNFHILGLFWPFKLFGHF
eukprot:TRINITY_DN29997_c2_g1_i1.p1 TRINITY_DN29997_c2_g1~~TRINITY_DN29997_c2_g1_i1.p1  ORF type:complete len:113 (+),score=3.65 TRINITY_DN29997_c2_g1_i1:537-875(+)